MRFDPLFLPNASVRYPVYANRGMVAASSPQASAAGLDALRRGGNAADAAVATAAALTVVEPTANGIGSDAFALVWMAREKKLYGLNASGWAARDISVEKVLQKHPGAASMPAAGWTPTMVPGAPAAWAALSARFGRLPMTASLEPAVSYAREGYPASAVLAAMWQAAVRRYQAADRMTPEFAEWHATFAKEGRAPKAGDTVRLANHACTLERIAESNAEAFYRGELADRMVEDSRAFGGFFCKEDFAEYAPAWVDPISVRYRGYDVCEIPPNGQGIVALMALNILGALPQAGGDPEETLHLHWEAMKIAFADGLAHVTDPRHMRVPPSDLLAPAYGAARAREIGARAGVYTSAMPHRSGTVYFAAADGEGNMVSYIQSNYMGFGSGIVARGTGISLQNRGADFSLDKAAANCLAPRKKTYHTIIPGFLLKDGEAVGPFGVMGGYMQPQGHVQVVTGLVDRGLNPQQALDAPRWQWMRDNRFLVENTFPIEIARALARRGHRVEVALENGTFGRGQIIVRLPNGTLVGGTEGRTDSNIACY